LEQRKLPLVSVVIPHWRGKEILFRCLNSLLAANTLSTEIYLIDNGSTDGSVDEAIRQFPLVKVIRAEKNLGFAGGCNLGIRESKGEYVLLLNDDADVTPGFLEPLVKAMEADTTIAACQPKICSIRYPKSFDYAGAAGGFLDIYGFPFCQGRIFTTIEEDRGQYDDPCEIFWASGACCLLKMSALRAVGPLDEEFFAHMEEIDLQWRLRLAGYKIVVVPTSTVRHEAGTTLSPDQPYKTYLNHRNSLIMILKNHRVKTLIHVLPVRLFLDSVAVLYRVLHGQILNAFAILRALGYVLFNLTAILQRRDQRKAMVRQSDRILPVLMYRRSIVWDYFLLKRRKFPDLPPQAFVRAGND